MSTHIDEDLVVINQAQSYLENRGQQSCPTDHCLSFLPINPDPGNAIPQASALQF
jgi:hypothetical protein